MRGDPLVLAALAQAESTFQALVLREVAAVEQVGAATDAVFGSVGALLQDARGCLLRDAAGTVRLATRLRGDLAPVGGLLLSGEVTRRHCETVLVGLRGLTGEQLAQVLPSVCQAARVMDPTLLTMVLREHAEAISPQLAEHLRRRLEERTGFTLDEGPDGTGYLLGPTNAQDRAILAAHLDAKTHGERVAGDLRTAARRRLDALIELARHGLDCVGLDVLQHGGALLLHTSGGEGDAISDAQGSWCSSWRRTDGSGR